MVVQKFNTKAKIILTGEHAVVYGFTAVATPIPLEMSVQIVDHSENCVTQNDDLKNMIAQIVNDDRAVKEFFKRYDLSISSDIPVSAGLGSSAALSLCIAKVVMFIENGLQMGFEYNDKNLIELANTVEALFHLHPSGIDVTTIALQKMIKFNSLQKYSHVQNKSELYIGAINTGKRNIQTKDAIQKLHDERNYQLFKVIGEIGEEFSKALENADYHMIACLINENQKILKTLGCVTQKMEEACEYLLSNDAIAAKMTGAGFGGTVFGLFRSLPNLKHCQVQSKLET